ncbi:hypothetical protein [Candidatus Paracaedibacter symbiosus]|uniref:hypothetical protein n=1 Tax=Candidatus Paracaedibacter symbiosus TaxID=244582 RepID=UPI000509592C|nr:hypothetical protein [Candidatus Paracaedibacter symbiosus]
MQIFNRRGVRGSFNHPLIPQNVQTSLSSIVGKIFHITQEEGEPEDVMDIGSGMMAKLTNGKPSNIKNGDMLNGVMSCAHVLESGGDEHLIGVYFVAHDHLNPITGLPEDQINPVNSAQDLMQYLRTNPNSYEIDLYSIKRRTNLISIIEGNNVNATNPQYWSNEDIIFGTFKTVAHLYSHNTRIKFNTITADTPFKITKRRKPYFAAGYPGCSHYNKRKFKGDANYSLIKEIGLSPLHITSALPKYHKGVLKRPLLKDGRILHEAPAAKGMSGGPLFRVKNTKVKIFGCITSGEDGEEEGCY